jgi:hypothetical protein
VSRITDVVSITCEGDVSVHLDYDNRILWTRKLMKNINLSLAILEAGKSKSKALESAIFNASIWMIVPQRSICKGLVARVIVWGGTVDL